jgi:hypothetical protein
MSGKKSMLTRREAVCGNNLKCHSLNPAGKSEFSGIIAIALNNEPISSGWVKRLCAGYVIF